MNAQGSVGLDLAKRAPSRQSWIGRIKGHPMGETSSARIPLATACPGSPFDTQGRELCRTTPPCGRGVSHLGFDIGIQVSGSSFFSSAWCLMTTASTIKITSSAIFVAWSAILSRHRATIIRWTARVMVFGSSSI